MAIADRQVAQTVADPPRVVPQAAYVHVPFCRHRCGYCDFTLLADRPDRIDDYLRALAIELSRLEGPHHVDTLFFGGGTPSYLSADQLDRLLSLVRQWMIPTSDAEVSLEANPEDITADRLDVLATHGVNRVSVGAQAMDGASLRALDRSHAPDDVVRTVNRLRELTDNISLDLIFAAPGQSLTRWRETLQATIELDPAHVSVYGLTFEKGTQFWTRRQKGSLRAAADELQRQMYELAMEVLPAAGFEQYELSNFARPGFACRHNQVYWRGDDFFGFGPGAASYIDGVRRTNHRSVTTWIRRTLAGEPAIGIEERLEPEEQAGEAVMLGLRQTPGIDVVEFERRTGFTLEQLAPDALRNHLAAGLLVEDGPHIRLSREGRHLADTVIVDFL